MRIAVTGATGLVGGALTKRLLARGDEVVALTRDPERAEASLPTEAVVFRWEVGNPGLIKDALTGVDAVINLAGEPIFGRRWNAGVKEELRRSRVEGTATIVEAMKEARAGPSVLVNASAIGYYGARDDEEIAEEAEPGSDFLAELCVAWEEAAAGAELAGARVVMVRIGIVLASSGGALEKMLPPMKAFVGGRIGHGRQGFSWIHIDDLVGLLIHAMESRELRGPVNGTAPHPLSNRGFVKALGAAIGRPSWLPAPGFMLRLMLGEVAGLLTAGQFVVPKRATETGYEFRFPTAPAALTDLLGSVSG